MSYRVNLRRVDDDHFALVYGRGRRKVTATLKRDGRGWKFVAGCGGAAMVELGVTKLQRLKARWAEWIATAPTVEDPASAPTHTAARLENIAPNVCATDDCGPVNTFKPCNDYERGLLDAARLCASIPSMTVTRRVIAERERGAVPARTSMSPSALIARKESAHVQQCE